MFNLFRCVDLDHARSDAVDFAIMKSAHLLTVSDKAKIVGHIVNVIVINDSDGYSVSL